MGQLLCCCRRNKRQKTQLRHVSTTQTVRPLVLKTLTIPTLIIKPYHEYNLSSKYSRKAIDWLNYVSEHNDIFIRHAENVGELTIYYNDNGKVRRFYADGFCEENNTIYEFHGDFWHGNPKFFNPNEYQPKLGKTYGQAYQDTLEKERLIRTRYKLVVIWEHEWDRMKFNW